MSHYIYNGKIVASNERILTPESRGLRYGEGVFETIKVKNDKVYFLSDHFQRLEQGLHALHLQLPGFLDRQKLEELILKLAVKNGHTTARIRLMCWRKDGGLYDVVSDVCDYSIQSYALPVEYEVNSNGLDLCIFDAVKKSIDLLSNVKHNNFLIYSLAARYAQEKKCNDALVLNQHNDICDSSIANIFWIKDGNIFTNPLTDGPIAGVMRKQLLQQLPSLGFPITEKSCSATELMEADEVFLSNVIRGCRWVKQLGDKQFSCEKFMEFYPKFIVRISI